MEIYYSGRSQCKPKHSSGPAMRDHYILHYVSSGRGVYTSGGNSYSILPGQGFLTLPGIINYHIADASDPWFYTWVAFKGDNVPEILKGLQFDGDALVFEVIKENQVFFELILDKIITSSDSDFKTYLLHTGNIYNLLSSINILSSLDPEIDTMYKRYKKYNNDEYINKALDYIYKNYCRDVHIKDIAQHVSLDHKYLCMLFHKKLGVTPYKMLWNFRMRKACELLSKEKICIGEVARSVGYDDQLVFSKAFRKYNGRSPTEFRNKSIEI